MEEMLKTRVEAEKRIRDEFQQKHPHYTPPPDASQEVWGSWLLANICLHGPEGFEARFPAQFALMDEWWKAEEADTPLDQTISHQEVTARLRALTYPG